MMVADNDDAYNLTPSFILETVQPVKGLFLNEMRRTHGRQEG